MEKMREEEKRSGQPHNNSAGAGRSRGEAPLGFEGMNFEQKRKPYRNVNQPNKDGGPSEGENNSGKRRDDL